MEAMLGSGELPKQPLITEARSAEDIIVQDNIEKLLSDPMRKNVEHAFSLHNMVPAPGGIRLHMVLKFKYDEELIESCFGAKKPDLDVVKMYNSAHRLFPYCIFNSVEESPISWTYQNNGGRVYERIELIATVTSVQYMRYFPFVLKLLNLKVGSDGTGKTGTINLLPERKKGTDVPNVDFGVFTKETSAYRIARDGVETGDVICRMVVRDLSGDSLGNLAGIYTRVYTVFFFEAPWLETFCTYIVFSTLMVHLTIFLPRLALGDLIGTALAIALTAVALLFVMPPSNEFTTAEIVVLLQALYVLASAAAIGLLQPPSCADVTPECTFRSAAPSTLRAGHGASTPYEITTPCNGECVIMQWHVFACNALVTALTAAFVLREHGMYLGLVRKIKGKFRSVHAYVGMFKDIDGQI